MNVPMSVTPRPEILFNIMDWVSVLLMISLVVFAFVMACGRFADSRRKNAGFNLNEDPVLDEGSNPSPSPNPNKDLSLVFVWLSAAFVSASVLLYGTPVGSIVSLFTGDVLHLGYIEPIMLASASLLSSVLFMVSAGIVAFPARERKPKQARKIKQREDKPAKPEYLGTEVFTNSDR